MPEFERILATRDSALAERDAAFAAQDLARSQRDAAMAARDAAFAQRDAALAARDAAFAERDAALAARDLALRERDRVTLEMAEIGNIIAAQGDEMQTLTSYANHQTMLPLPSEEYMRLVSGQYPMPQLVEAFSGAGKLVADMLADENMLGKNVRFLDVGCGCGRLARNLLNKGITSYTGFDRHAGMINWCRREITTRFPNFRFYYFNLKSAYETMDKQQGDIDASSFRFPFKDNAFNSIIVASVFTHMPMQEISNYLKEIYRTLTDDGRVMLSVFFHAREEERREDADFYFGERMFLNAVEKANFEYRYFRQTGEHRWYLLTRAAAGA